MNEQEMTLSSRRQFINATGRVAVASALAGVALPHVHAAGSDYIQAALVGCGGRGTGAIGNALAIKGGGVKLVAMADLFEDRLDRSYQALKRATRDMAPLTSKTADSLVGGFDAGQVEVPPDRRFLGFDGYQKAMDCLKPGDVVILATPPAFRWVHFTYAIKRGLNVFMEKPVSVDGPTTRRMLALADEADKKNLKVGVGLMCRHCKGRQALFEQIKAGQVGDIMYLRGYRMAGQTCTVGPKPADLTEVLYQTKHFKSFLWGSGGLFEEWNVHQIDECCWMKDAWPIKAQATGGRHYRGNSLDQNFDNYNIEYTFADGAKLFFVSRAENGCYPDFSSYVHGTKASAIISTFMHTPSQARIFKGQTVNARDLRSENVLWAFPQPEPSPYLLEWEELLDAIRQNRPYNEVKRSAQASLVTALGRMAAHTGQVITYDEMLNCPHEFAPDVDKLTIDGPAPLLANADGAYPVPEPGIKRNREY